MGMETVRNLLQQVGGKYELASISEIFDKESIYRFDKLKS